MRIDIKTTTTLKSYDELNEDARAKAFDEHATFLNDIEEINLYDLNTDDLKETVEESIIINDYLFYENGELANITQHIGKNNKTEKVIFKHCGVTYDITKSFKGGF